MLGLPRRRTATERAKGIRWHTTPDGRRIASVPNPCLDDPRHPGCPSCARDRRRARLTPAQRAAEDTREAAQRRADKADLDARLASGRGLPAALRPQIRSVEW